MIAPGRARAGRRVRRQGLAGGVGHPPRARLRGRRPLPRPRHRRLQRRVGRVRPGLRRPSGACTLHRGRPARPTTASTSRPGRRRPSGCRARPAGCRKRHLFDQAARRRRLRRGGHRPQPRRRGGGAVRQRAALADRLPRPPAPGAARPATASRARSSRSCASASARWRRTACSGASTTSSRSARWPPATSTSATRRRSTPSRPRRPARSTTSTSASSPRASERFRAEAEAEQARRSRPCTRCGAPTHRRGVRVLPAGRARRRHVADRSPLEPATADRRPTPCP